MNTISFNKVCKYFGNIGAVKSLSLKVEQGEIFGFLGPNGAGKTTTIRMMLDFIRPTSGEIKIFDLDCRSHAAEIRSRIGYLSCENTSFRFWTGKEHFKFLESLRGRKSTSLKSLVDRLDFNQRAQVRTLSSGNLQKLNFILALMFDPEVIILDEPTKALDPILQQEVYKVLRELNRKGSTIFMSSHNLAEVESFCTRTGIIKEGILISTETMSDRKSRQIYNIDLLPIDNIDLKIFKIPTVDSVEKEHGIIKLKIKGDINPVLDIISKYKVKDVTIGKATLEEIFMEFYR